MYKDGKIYVHYSEDVLMPTIFLKRMLKKDVATLFKNKRNQWAFNSDASGNGETVKNLSKGSGQLGFRLNSHFGER